MSTPGRDGSWNRAGRRSGGARPREIRVTRSPGVRVLCPTCGNPDAPALVTRGCAGCAEIHRLWLAEQRSASQPHHAHDAPPPPDPPDSPEATPSKGSSDTRLKGHYAQHRGSK